MGGKVEQDHGVVVGGGGLGVVGVHALARGAFQLHGLVAEVRSPTWGWWKGFAVLAVAFDLVSLPEAGEFGAFEQEFADELGEVGGVGVGAGQGAQAGDAAARPCADC